MAAFVIILLFPIFGSIGGLIAVAVIARRTGHVGRDFGLVLAPAAICVGLPYAASFFVSEAGPAAAYIGLPIGTMASALYLAFKSWPDGGGARDEADGQP